MMNIFLLFYMCHFVMGLTHCYKTTVFFTFIIINVPFPWRLCMLSRAVDFLVIILCFVIS